MGQQMSSESGSSKGPVYLCGGINGLSDTDCRDWREVAKILLKTKTLDPMRRDYRGREDECVDEIVQGDLEDIDASEFVLVNATRPSWGTAMEVFYAHQRDKKAVAFVGPSRVSPWLRKHTSKVVLSLDEACDWINKQNTALKSSGFAIDILASEPR